MEPVRSLFIGHDGREAVASEVAAHSIVNRTDSDVRIIFLKHRELRKDGYFARPWLVDGPTGNFSDLIDGRPFSTEFSHTRFLVPALMGYKGWALFLDADMIFLSDVEDLFKLCNNKYAAMVVKHNHVVKSGSIKMDNREQLAYNRKNWSSFVLWNCGHPANKTLTPEKVNFMKGSDLHNFTWLTDSQIGSLPFTYNYISGVSPPLTEAKNHLPDVIHYTEGGPWFENCQDVPYAKLWLDEYEDYQRNRGDFFVCDVPTLKHDLKEIIR